MLNDARHATPRRPIVRRSEVGTLLVASTGGHLEELYRLRTRFVPRLDEVQWVTFDTPQARHLLAAERVYYVRLVAPKDVKHTAAAFRDAHRILGNGEFDRVISTGAAVAVPFLAIATVKGMETHYIESAARSVAPSLSGRMVAHLRKIHLYAQYPQWSDDKWMYRGTVFDGFARGPRSRVMTLNRVVVTFGTQAGFGFRRAVERLVKVLPDVCASDATILWQTGATDTSGLPVQPHPSVPAKDLADAVRDADLVVGHAGIGSALLALEHGHCPVLLPRRRSFAEHTDDHQGLIARDLSDRGLAIAAEADRVNCADLLTASRMSALPTQAVAPFRLELNLCHAPARRDRWTI